MTQKNILITGGLGFLGSHLAKKYVFQGDNVSILSRSDTKLNNISGIESKVNLEIKDVRDIDSSDVVGKDYIFHFAGSVDNYSLKADNPDRNPYLDIDVNCTSTISLLETLKDFNPSARLIFASTFFVNGQLGVEHLPATPESPCNPLGLYSATKLCAEHFCHAYHHNFGLDIIISRFTNVFGPFELGDNPLKAGFNFMINQAVRKETLNLYNNGDFYRDYIYVDDAVDACMTLADKGVSDTVYYVGRGDFVKFKELINIIEEILPGTKTQPIEPPKFHKKVGITDFVSDPSLLKSLGWSPKVSLWDGIRRTIDYYSS